MRKTCLSEMQNDFLPVMVRRCIFSWLAAAVCVYILLNAEEKSLDGQNGLKKMSFPAFLLCAALAFGILCALAVWKKEKTEKAERWGLPFLFGVLGALTLSASFTAPYFCILMLTEILLIVYAIFGHKDDWKEDAVYEPEGETHRRTAYKPEKGSCRRPVHEQKEKSHQRSAFAWEEKSCRKPAFVQGFVLFCGLLFFTFVAVWTVFRVLTYSAPTYDFGIFSQMFHQMSKTGLAQTTLERDGLLSHLKVHVSPIYYLLLPFYYLCPKPATLQVLQAALLALAAVPAWKLARLLGLRRWESAFLCLLLFLYPSYSGGASYDLHENAFLTLLLLWLFYMIECESGWGTAVFGALTCMVKEDAAVYVAVIGLWLLVRTLFGKKDKRRFGIRAGLGLLAGSIFWFSAATGYLARYGDGVMTNRYSNFMYDGSDSLLTVIKASLLSPMKVLYECADWEKVEFIGLTMLPLCGIPLMTRKYERFILLIPYVLVNLMSDYQYQHDIFFQYTYGSTACLFYLMAANYADLVFRIKKSFVRFLPLLLAVLISGGCFAAVVVPKALRYPSMYLSDRKHFCEISEVLQSIPEDAAVAATTFYTVPLSNRKIIYDVRYASKEHLLEADYVVLAWKDEGSLKKYAGAGEDGFMKLVEFLEENGYEENVCLENTLVIYKR